MVDALALSLPPLAHLETLRDVVDSLDRHRQALVVCLNLRGLRR